MLYFSVYLLFTDSLINKNLIFSLRQKFVPIYATDLNVLTSSLVALYGSAAGPPQQSVDPIAAVMTGPLLLPMKNISIC